MEFIDIGIVLLVGVVVRVSAGIIGVPIRCLIKGVKYILFFEEGIMNHKK